jgi:hypothetical protein
MSFPPPGTVSSPSPPDILFSAIRRCELLSSMSRLVRAPSLNFESPTGIVGELLILAAASLGACALQHNFRGKCP